MAELSRIKRRKGGFEVEKDKKKLVIMRSCSLCFAEDDKEMYESL